MHLGSRWLTWFAAALVVALLVSPATAFAGEGDPAEDETTTESATPTTIVGTDGGKRTIRITTGKDGHFRILVPEIVTEKVTTDGNTESAVRMIVTGPNGEQQVKRLHLQNGAWIVEENGPARVEGRIVARDEAPAVVMRRAAAGFAVPAQRSPMTTIFKWLAGGASGASAAGCPIQAWFDGGPDVPLAGLRDALKTDGWTAEQLRTWAHSNLAGLLMGMPISAQPRVHARAPLPRPAQAPRAGQWFRAARPSCSSCQNDRGCGGGCRAHATPQQQSRGCGQCPHHARAPRQGCGCTEYGHGRAYGRGQRHPQQRGCGCGQQQGYGQGWCQPPQHAPMPQRGCGCGQRQGGGFVPHHGRAPAPPRMTFPTQTRRARPSCPSCSGPGQERREVEVETSEADGTARAIVEGLKLLPPDLLEQVPPEILEAVLKEMNGLGLGELLAPASKCDTCPKRDGCKDKRASSCAGTCSDCPKQGSCDGECGNDCKGKSGSSCAGDCDDCPKRGTCGGSGSCGGNCKSKGKTEAETEAPSVK